MIEKSLNFLNFEKHIETSKSNIIIGGYPSNTLKDMKKIELNLFHQKLSNQVLILVCILVTPILSFLIYGIGGALLGEFLHPHAQHYMCACDIPPLLSFREATVLGIIYFVILILGLFYVLKRQITDKHVLCLTLLSSAITNFLACYFSWWILTVQTTG